MRKMLIALAGWLVLGAAAHAQVKDDAGFFSPEAVQKANAAIAEIKSAYKKDVKFETFKTVPADLIAKAKADAAKFFPAWADNRARTLKVDGIYVLICKEPTKLEVEVDNATSNKAFTRADRDKMVATLIGDFKQKAFDKGLGDSVALVRQILEKNLGPASPAPALNVVHDHAKLFSPEAVAQANKEIKEFKDSFKKDLVIETFAQPPPELKAKLDQGADKNKVFDEWISQREKLLKADGIHVLICKDPAHIHVGVSDKTRQNMFRDEDRNQLVQALVANFKAKNFDKGLSAALDVVYDTVDRHVSAPVPPPMPDSLVDFTKTVAPATVSRLSEELKAIKSDLGSDVTVETFARVPPGKVKQTEALSPEAREKALLAWEAERAKASGAGGIYVMLVKDPAWVKVSADEFAAKQFGAAQQRELEQLLLKRLKENATDKGLEEAVATIRNAVPALTVKDDGGFFSPAAVESANNAIKNMQQRFTKRVLVETYAAPPEDKTKGVDFSNTEVRNKFFANWAHERQKAFGIDGVSLLVCKEPMALQVATGPVTGKTFSAEEREQLVKTVVARFREKNFDAGLADGLAFVEATLARNATGTAQAPKEQAVVQKLEALPTPDKEGKKEIQVAQAAPQAKNNPMDKIREAASDNTVKWVLIGVAGLIGLWILIGIIRALSRAGRPAPQAPPTYQNRQAPPANYPPQNTGRPNMPPQAPGYGQPGYGQPAGYGPGGQPYPVGMPPAQGGGGGFLSSLMGGMFGAAAGSWLSNRLGGGSTTTIHQHYTQGAAPPAPPPVTPTGPGYAGSGGDFGQPDSPGYTSSGGDFGATEEPGQYASSGGDFGAPEQQAASDQDAGQSTGGDWGESAPDQAPAGGDRGDTSGADQGTDQGASGGDWGSSGADTGGGSWGGDAGGGGGGDWGGSSGGDAGGGSGGGDWGGGGDSSG